MSYEGYVQCLCSNGHLWTQDCYDDDSTCPDCKGDAVWTNGVDETNGEEVGYIDMGQFEAYPAVITTCEHCGMKKCHAEPIYRIPTPEEKRALRTFRPCGGEPHYLETNQPVKSQSKEVPDVQA